MVKPGSQCDQVLGLGVAWPCFLELSHVRCCSDAMPGHGLALLCLLPFLQGANASDLAAAKPVAAAVASEFSRSSEMFQFDLLDNPAVKALAGDAQHGALYQLLSIFLSGMVQVRGWEVGRILG